jgi:protein-disulfide isomerase
MNRLQVKSIALAVALCFAGARLASAADAFNPAQKDEVRKLVREYLSEHPEAVMEAINALQAKDEKAKTDKQVSAIKDRKKDIFEQTDGTVLGNPKGNVTLVEFFDYNCGYCKAMFPALMDVVKADGNVKLVVKEFPILGPPSVTASKAALAARKQTKYNELHLALMSHKGALTDDGVIQIAMDAGLDVAKLQKDMADPAISAILNKNRDLAQDLDIQGTPALIIGETLVPGAIDKARMAELIKIARK